MNKKIYAFIISIILVILILVGIYIVSKKYIGNNLNNVNIANMNRNNTSNENLMEINEESEIMKLYIKVKDKTLEASLEKNTSVDALIEKLKQSDMTINMSDYANFEKVGALGFDLPRNDKQITTEPGDIILYQGNSLSIYYDTNNWSFTKIGKIENVNQNELKEILGEGDVTVTFSINK